MEYAGLVVADDLTGAMDTGNEFARRGYATTVALGSEVRDPGASVAVVNAKSRYMPAADAATAVTGAVRNHSSDVLYKKVDSTLRGNVVAEIDAAIAAADADIAVVAPAFPGNGRTTKDGIHRVDGTPVTKTTAGRDPDKPVQTAHLPSLLESSMHSVVHLSSEDVEAGPAAVAEALEAFASRHGTAVVACDATRDDHLAAIAAGAADSGRDVVYVGSAGLACHVDMPDEKHGTRLELQQRTEGVPHVLGIAGSTNPATVAQAEAVPHERCVGLDIQQSILTSETAADAAAEQCLDLLDGGGTALVTTVDVDPEDALQVGRERGISEREVRERISLTLGQVARCVHETIGVTGLFLTGGAVAIDVLDALGTEGIELTGREVGTGIPLGRIVGGGAAGVPIVTKAGAFGDPETIANCLASFRVHDE